MMKGEYYFSFKYVKMFDQSLMQLFDSAYDPNKQYNHVNEECDNPAYTNNDYTILHELIQRYSFDKACQINFYMQIERVKHLKQLLATNCLNDNERTNYTRETNLRCKDLLYSYLQEALTTNKAFSRLNSLRLAICVPPFSHIA